MRCGYGTAQSALFSEAAAETEIFNANSLAEFRTWKRAQAINLINKKLFSSSQSTQLCKFVSKRMSESCLLLLPQAASSRFMQPPRDKLELQSTHHLSTLLQTEYLTYQLLY